MTHEGLKNLPSTNAKKEFYIFFHGFSDCGYVLIIWYISINFVYLIEKLYNSHILHQLVHIWSSIQFSYFLCKRKKTGSANSKKSQKKTHRDASDVSRDKSIVAMSSLTIFFPSLSSFHFPLVFQIFKINQSQFEIKIYHIT